MDKRILRVPQCKRTVLTETNENTEIKQLSGDQENMFRSRLYKKFGKLFTDK
jgi:hypothetical protein